MESASDNILLEALPSKPYRFPVLRYPYENQNEEGDYPQIHEYQMSDINKNENIENVFCNGTNISASLFKFNGQRTDKKSFLLNDATEFDMLKASATSNTNPHLAKLMEAHAEDERKKTTIKIRPSLENKILELHLRKRKAKSEDKTCKKVTKIF